MPSHYGLPLTIDMHERSRMQESARRRRLLDGVWEADLVETMSQYVAPEQMAAWGRPDLTKNVFRSVVSQLSILYDREPIIEHEDPVAAERMRELCRSAGVWTQGPQLQRLVIGQREALRRVSWEDGALLVRLVPVDTVEASSSPNTPSTAHTVIEYRHRELDGQELLTRDVLSVAGGVGVYRIESGDGKRDLTSMFLGADYSGEAYPYRRGDGSPVLPYVMTHALDTGRLFDTYEGRELVEGSLKVAVLWSFWSHIVFDCSHPQRYGVNARPAGLAADARNDEHATFIATDPASLLLMETSNPDAPVQLGQFAPGGDPVAVGTAIRDYASDLAMDFDLSPGDIQRSHGDARSGYAIHVVNEGKRRAQLKYQPQFARADVELLEVIAALHNTYSGEAPLPETGYSVRYQGLPLSVDERRTRIEEYRTRSELGIASPVQLLAELEGITEDQARARLAQIRRDRVEFGTI